MGGTSRGVGRKGSQEMCGGDVEQGGWAREEEM